MIHREAICDKVKRVFRMKQRLYTFIENVRFDIRSLIKYEKEFLFVIIIYKYSTSFHLVLWIKQLL